MLFSSVLYFSLIVFVLLLVHISAKKEKFRYALMAIMLLSLIAGLRASTVGKDTNTYFLIFDRLMNKLSPLTYIYIPNVEETFLMIVRALLFICNNYSFVLFAFAFLTNFLIIRRFWDFRDTSSFTFSVLVYYLSFFFLSMNISRQICAVAFVFFGTRYIERKKYWLFIMFVAMGVCFHTSALLGCLFILREIPQWRSLTKNQRVLLAMILFGGLLSSSFFVISFRKYSHYFASPSLSIGPVIFVKLFLFIMLTYLFYRGSLYSVYSDKGVSSVTVYVYVGIVFMTIGYVFQYMNRTSFCFSIFDCVYLGYIKNQKNQTNRIILYSVSLLVFGGLFIIDLLGNGNGTVPYRFLWE